MAPPANSAFKQQTLRAWRPILTPRLVIALFSLGGILFVPIGAVILVFSNQVVEIVGGDYAAASGSGCCKSNCDSLIPWERVDYNPCDVTLTVTQRMEPPIFMYYKLTDYYQNHRRYVRSRDDNQLRGRDVTEADLLDSSSCRYHVLDGPAGDPSSLISPCGLVAFSVFNDSYQLFQGSSSTESPEIPLNENGIAWPSDLQYKFKNNANGTSGNKFPPFAFERSRTCADLPAGSLQTACLESPATPQAGWCFPGSGYCVEDEHFVIWMRAAGLPNFRKLYAVINTTLEPGPYTVRVSNGYSDDGGSTYKNAFAGDQLQDFLYPVSSFGGTKSIVLSTTTALGGRNFFLGYAYVVVGVVCIVLALCFLFKYRMQPRDLGDASYITWQAKDGVPS